MVVKTLTKDDMTQAEIIETEIRKPILQRSIQMHVCSLCLRVYDLLEDLLGHMIEYHHYKRATDVETNKNKAKEEEKDNVIEPSQTEQQVGTIVSQPSTKEASNSAVNQLAPMSYKELRLFLRKNWKVPCRLYAKCPYKFENNVSAVYHAKCHIAGDMERFKCFKCNLKLTTWRRCAAHLWLSHQLEADLLHCPLCEYKTYTTVNIWEHMRVHRNWHAERAKLKKKLTKSTKMIAGDDASKGSNLNRYYSQKVCTICQRKFVNGKTLSKHVKTVHNNIKPFRCNICGMKTARKASLVIHMRQHTGEKPLKCKKCTFATRDPSVLHKHQLRHEKTKKLKCSFCDYSCIQTNLYKRHMRLKHPQEYKKIACDICSFVTITTEKLLAHKEDHQRGLIGNTEDSADTGYRSASKHTGNPNADCFMPLESIDSLPHEPAVDTGGVTIPAPPNEDTQFPLYLND